MSLDENIILGERSQSQKIIYASHLYKMSRTDKSTESGFIVAKHLGKEMWEVTA